MTINKLPPRIELDHIYNMDCTEGLALIPDGSVDCIIVDPPYGTMRGYGKSVADYDETRHDWDIALPTEWLFESFGRVLRRNGMAIIFSQEPYTSQLRTTKGTWLEFCYPMIWRKDRPGNALLAPYAPLGYFEDISVFVRRGNNDAEKAHPLRSYAAQVVDYIGKTCGEIQNDLRAWNIPQPTRVAHFLRADSLQFGLCTEETYNLLIERYHINAMPGFRTWQSLNADEQNFRDSARKVFNLPEGKAHVSNVLEVDKEADTFHPTQKPVNLIRRLIAAYSNPGDTILDNCMGSGTTAVAAIREKRHFIGFELDKGYFDKACRRIRAEQAQLTLF